MNSYFQGGGWVFTSHPRPTALLASALAAMVLVFISCAASLQAHELYTDPYLVQTTDPSCMQVVFQTDCNLHGSWIRWGYSEDDRRHTVSPIPVHLNIKNESCSTCRAEDFTRWDAWICAEPGMRVFYKVYISENMDYDDDDAEFVIAADFHLPLHPDAKHLTFFGYGDTRSCEEDFNTVSDELRNKVEAHASATKTFLLHSGDVVYNGGRTFYSYKDSHWMEYFKEWDESKYLLRGVPVAVSMGNHDFAWEDEGSYPKFYYTNFPYPQYEDSVGHIPHLDGDGDMVGDINEAYYSFDYGPVHVAVLNAYHTYQLDDLGACTIGDGLIPGYAQHNWLASDLASTDKPWKVIMIHVSPISCDCDKYTSADARAGLWDLAEAHGVDLIISGHDHYYAKCHERGIPHFVLGGGGADLTDTGDCHRCDRSGSFFQFGRFTVDAHMLRFDNFAFDEDNDTWYLEENVQYTHDDDPVSDSVAFETSFTSTDYHDPIRFTCTTEGKHTDHLWDLGGGTTSTDANPYHTYAKPTADDGYGRYTPTLKISNDDGATWISADKEIEVFNGGTLEIGLGNDIMYDIKYALFLTPPGQTVDLDRDFWRILEGDENLDLNRLAPGEWTVTVRPLGHTQEQQVETVEAEGWTNVQDIHPERNIDFDETSVAIGSIPSGADVTISYWDGHETQTLSGTTPFYAYFCCPNNPVTPRGCTYDWEITNGSIQAQGTADLLTLSCQNVGATLSQVYVDVREPAAIGLASETQRIHILSQPSNQRVVNDGSARLEIHARSKEALTYRWHEGESGDRSKPIYGATGPVYVTPATGSEKKYWVRVTGRLEFRDSPTVTVSTVAEGPVVNGLEPAVPDPDLPVTIIGGPFDPEEVHHTHVYFDEHKAIVNEVREGSIVVEFPPGIANRNKVTLRIKSGGVWSKAHEIQRRQGRADLPFEVE